jgi:uncharacterized membrane protein (UPF0127 family)
VKPGSVPVRNVARNQICRGGYARGAGRPASRGSDRPGLLRVLLACAAALTFAALLGMTLSCRTKPAPVAASAPIAASAPRVILPDGFPVVVEIAASDEMREQGLMYRDSLPADKGMIFLFTTMGEYAFWMKNTLIPLDMIWIDDQKRVVHVGRDIPPCRADPCPSYPPHAAARAVLELAAGSARAHKVVDGSRLRFERIDGVPVR